MIDPGTAEQMIAEAIGRFPVESLPLAQCAGAVLHEDIVAERDLPPFDRVAMDGIALRADGWTAGRALTLQATQGAGAPPLQLQAPDHCIEIMTGAVLPSGCDTVVPVERLRRDGTRVYIDLPALERGSHIHRRGTDRPGGSVLLQRGCILRGPELAIAASAGVPRVRVSVPPSILVVSTGNELIEPGEPITDYQVRRSNAYGIAAALRRRGFGRVADDHLPDEEPVMAERLRAHLLTHDVLILSGGVSAGRFDLLPGVLERLGVRRVLHGIAQRPGRPMWVGVTAQGKPVFALPGNPVSTMVCTARYVLPALQVAMGGTARRQERARLTRALHWRVPLTGLLAVVLEQDAEARLCADLAPHNGSGDLASLAHAAGCVEIARGPLSLPEGFVAPLYRW